MAQIRLLYWRDIPAQIVAETGRGRDRKQAKIELPRRFALAIDEAAMRGDAASTDDYLADWRRGAAPPCSEDLQAEAARLAADTEAAWPAERVADLVRNGGFDPQRPA